MSTLRTFLILTLAILGYFGSGATYADAGNLTGYAWSSNIGWVSMNCENHAGCNVSQYGVNVLPSGLMEGYAWSPNIGWLSFQSSDLSGCPSGVCEARFTKGNSQVSGWVRACAVFVANCSGALKPATQRGNWEGWIHLRGGSGANAYGVYVSGTIWSSFAWGGPNDPMLTDGVIGWLSFSGPGYAVVGSGDAASDGPFVSCGGMPGATRANRDVTWKCTSYGVTPSNIQWTFNGTGVNPPNPTTVAGASTIVKRYSQTGDKTANTIINPGAADQFDAGVSTGASLNGIDPGFGLVQIGDFDLAGMRPRNPGSVMESMSVVFQGDILGAEINPGPLLIPFTSAFEIALDGAVGGGPGPGGPSCPAAGMASDVSIRTNVISSINEGERKTVMATWPSALLGDDNGDGVGAHCVRLCADDQNVIDETDEPGAANNCGQWRYFAVTPIPPPPIDATCTVSPVIVRVHDKKIITWTVTPSGGNGTYSYVWRGSENLSGTTQTVTKVYNTVGEKTATVTITSPGAPNSPMDVVCSKKVIVQEVTEN